MAYWEITEPTETAQSFAADEDADVAAIETAYPDAPVGSLIVAGNGGTPRIYFKFPSGSFYKIYGEDAT